MVNQVDPVLLGGSVMQIPVACSTQKHGGERTTLSHE